MATVWDEAAHLCLLQGVFVNVTFTAEEWQRILKYTEDRGYGYTSGAAMYSSLFTLFPHFLSSSSSQTSLPNFTPPQLPFSFHLVSIPPITTQPQSATRRASCPCTSTSSPLPVVSLVTMDTPKAADQRMTWDHVADKDLLGAICDELAPTQEQVRSVTARMHALGYTCTVKAISY